MTTCVVTFTSKIGSIHLFSVAQWNWKFMFLCILYPELKYFYPQINISNKPKKEWNWSFYHYLKNLGCRHSYKIWIVDMKFPPFSLPEWIIKFNLKRSSWLYRYHQVFNWDSQRSNLLETTFLQRETNQKKNASSRPITFWNTGFFPILSISMGRVKTFLFFTILLYQI